MSDSITPASLKTLLSQIEPARAAEATRPPERTATPSAQDGAARTTTTGERVDLPKDAVRFDPNAPRGTYLNLTV